MFIHEPLFEIDPSTEPTYEPQDDWFIRHEDGTQECPHCHDIDHAMWINHGRVFNGWCSKRLFLNSRAGWQDDILSGKINEYLDPSKYNQKQYGQKWIDTITEMNASDMKWLNDKGFGRVDAHDERNWA